MADARARARPVNDLRGRSDDRAAAYDAILHSVTPAFPHSTFHACGITVKL